MAWRDWGNPPVVSTGVPSVNPSTSTLIAELDSTQLGTKNLAVGQKLIVTATWIIGQTNSSGASWQLETCTSTALSAGVDIFYPFSPQNQSAQYVTTHELFKDYRMRARLFSSQAGTFHAYITAEVLT